MSDDSTKTEGDIETGVVIHGDFGGANKFSKVTPSKSGAEARAMLALLSGDGERAQRILDDADNRETQPIPKNLSHKLSQE